MPIKLTLKKPSGVTVTSGSKHRSEPKATQSVNSKVMKRVLGPNSDSAPAPAAIKSAASRSTAASGAANKPRGRKRDDDLHTSDVRLPQSAVMRLIKEKLNLLSGRDVSEIEPDVVSAISHSALVFISYLGTTASVIQQQTSNSRSIDGDDVLAAVEQLGLADLQSNTWSASLGEQLSARLANLKSEAAAVAASRKKARTVANMGNVADTSEASNVASPSALAKPSGEDEELGGTVDLSVEEDADISFDEGFSYGDDDDNDDDDGNEVANSAVDDSSDDSND
eukprot:SAG31_NODE_1151_length_9643_cov_15.981978_1_plen_282_part_00